MAIAIMESEHHLFEIAASQLSSCFGSSGGTCWSSRIGGYDWDCSYFTGSNGLSLSLAQPHPDILLEPHNVRFKFSLLDREGRPVPSRTRSSSFQNCCIRQGWKWTCDGFITREDLERPEYLNKDGGGTFTVRCDVSLKPFAAAKAADAFVTVPPSDLHQHLGCLLASKEGADVTFQVAGGGTFSAHRCVLAARSPVFRAQLFGEMKEGKTTAGGGSVVIEIEDMEASVFGSLLVFIYTDSLPEEEEEDDDDEEQVMVQYQRLLAAADMYGLERMKLVCQEKLCNHVRADSVARMLALADLHHCPGLKDACFDFLSSSANLESFTGTDGFELLTESCPAVLKELLAKLATVLIF